MQIEIEIERESLRLRQLAALLAFARGYAAAQPGRVLYDARGHYCGQVRRFGNIDCVTLETVRS